MITDGFIELAEKIIEQAKHIVELEREITAYQIAKDNLELREAVARFPHITEETLAKACADRNPSWQVY